MVAALPGCWEYLPITGVTPRAVLRSDLDRKGRSWVVVFLEVAEAPAIALSEKLYRVTEVGRPRLWVLEVRREELGEPLEGNFVHVGNDCRGFGGPAAGQPTPTSDSGNLTCWTGIAPLAGA